MSPIGNSVKSLRRLPDWAALLLLSLLVSLSNWPLITHFTTHVVGRPFDDVFGILWDLDWAQRALFDEHVSPFFAPDLFYPHGFHVSSSSPPMWWFVLFSPLTRLLGPVVAYNLISLAAFALAGFGMYLLVKHLGGRWLGAILAGATFVSAPVLTLRLAGHTDILLSSLWLPFLALASHRALEQPGRGRSLGTGILLGLACLGHWQFVFFAPLLPLLILLSGRTSATRRVRIIHLALIYVVALVTVAPFLLLTLHARQQMHSSNPAFSLAIAAPFSLSPDRLFVPNPLHGLWGNWSRRHFPVSSEAAVVSLGYTALALALLGAGRRWANRRTYLLLLALSLAGALGVIFHWNEQPVLVAWPPALARYLRPLVERLVGAELSPAATATPIPLPLAFLYHLVPLLNLTRVWARFMILGMLALGVLAGFGASALLARWPRGGGWLVLACLGLVWFEGLAAPYRDFTEVASNRRLVDDWLAAQQPAITLIEYPLPAFNKVAMYRQSLHRQRLVNGYASIAPSDFSAALPTLGQWPNPAGVDLLRQWGVDYVLVNGTLDSPFTEEVLPTIQAIETLCLTRVDREPERNFQTVLFRISRPGESCPPGAEEP